MSTFHRSIRYHRRPHHDVFAVSTFLSHFLFGFTWFQWEMAMLAVGLVHSAHLAWSLLFVEDSVRSCSNTTSISSHPLC